MVKKMVPLVSVVVPVFNMENFIENCLENIVNLDYENKEIIVVDDGSTDKTPELVRKFPVEYVKVDHKRTPMARSIGIENARGELVLTTDADCVLEKNALKALMEKMESEKADIVVGSGRFILNSENFLARSLGSFYSGSYYTALMSGVCALYKKNVLFDLGLYTYSSNKKFWRASEFNLHLRAIKRGYKVVTEAKAIAGYSYASSLKMDLKKHWSDSRIFSAVIYPQYPETLSNSGKFFILLYGYIFISPLIWHFLSIPALITFSPILLIGMKNLFDIPRNRKKVPELNLRIGHSIVKFIESFVWYAGIWRGILDYSLSGFKVK